MFLYHISIKIKLKFLHMYNTNSEITKLCIYACYRKKKREREV